MALEDLLREAATRGITHLSLSPTPSEDGKRTYWQARATPSTEHKYVMCACEDPVDAVTQVLAAMAKAPKRSRKPEPHLVQSPANALYGTMAAIAERQGLSEEFTAAVTEPRQTFTVPDGFTAARDDEGRATGELVKTAPEPVASAAPLNLEEEFASWLPKP